MSSTVDPTDEAINDASFVVSSQYRTAVLEQLTEKPATPKTLTERTGFAMSHISRALREMADRGLVELLVDESRTKGRIYGLTDRGQNAADFAQTL